MAVYVERFYVSHNQLQLKCMSYIESILNYSENFMKALLAHLLLPYGYYPRENTQVDNLLSTQVQVAFPKLSF